MATIKVPTKDGTRDATGKVIKLYVGQYQQKFLLQETAPGAIHLTHFASGYTLGPLDKFSCTGSHYQATPRERAIELIAELVAKHGADRINVKINSAPVIN